MGRPYRDGQPKRPQRALEHIAPKVLGVKTATGSCDLIR